MVDEQEFWNRKFDDTRAPSTPRRTTRGAFTAYPPSFRQRLADRFQDWRSDSRFGVVILIVVALVAGTVWYRIGMGGTGDAGAAPRRVDTAARAPSAHA